MKFRRCPGAAGNSEENKFSHSSPLPFTPKPGASIGTCRIRNIQILQLSFYGKAGKEASTPSDNLHLVKSWFSMDLLVFIVISHKSFPSIRKCFNSLGRRFLGPILLKYQQKSEKLPSFSPVFQAGKGWSIPGLRTLPGSPLCPFSLEKLVY